jgi:phage-related protein
MPVLVCLGVISRQPGLGREKPLHWVASAKTDYQTFPDEAQTDMGYALGLAQLGAKHPNAKP